MPEGMFQRCEACRKILYQEDVRDNWYCCPECGKHLRMDPWERIRLLVDEGSFQEWDADVLGSNFLQFPEYEEKLESMREKTGLTEAVITGEAVIRGNRIALGVMAADFLMGSMGTAVGEKITRLVERATDQRLPVVLFCCSGGARMQEGIFSLMQMAKTSQALKRHDEAGLLYISILTDPTTGGVTASFAMLGDIILAEPGALIGFAGPRVIAQTIGQKLPEGFQSAEFLLKHGFVDRIVKREQMRQTLAAILRSVAVTKKGQDLKSSLERTADLKRRLKSDEDLKKKTERTEDFPKPETTEALKLDGESQNAWMRVQAARSAVRPYPSDYIAAVFDGFMEFHGDRLYGDDRAVIGGVAALGKRFVTVIGQQKGRNLKENKYRNFGMPNPEGYRKALRLMKQAEKFGRPILLFVDTPGAFCGVEAEERGQGEAIARNLFEMAGLKVPILTIVTGEGGSGGALALAQANEVWMLENSVYSVLSPEGFAAILWKDGKRAREAAEVMKITAADLKKFGVIEKIISEETPADVGHMEKLAAVLREEILDFLQRYVKKTEAEIVEERYRRFRSIGAGQEK